MFPGRAPTSFLSRWPALGSLGLSTCLMSRVETRGHGDVGVEQTRDGTFRFCRERRIHEMRLRDVRNVCVHIELNAGKGPARGQIFQGCSRCGFDALGVKTGKT